MKKLLLTCLCISLIIVSYGAEFSDVSSRHWAKPYIDELTKIDVVGGYKDGTFRGSQPVHRYDLVAFLGKYNQYMQEKINLLLANVGEVPDAQADYSVKYGILEELEEELWNIRNDVKYLEGQLKSPGKMGGQSPVLFGLESRVMLDYKNSDLMSNYGWMQYTKQEDQLSFDFSVHTLRDQSLNRQVFIPFRVQGNYRAPVLNALYFTLSSGPGDQTDELGEVRSLYANRLTMQSEIMPIAVRYQQINQQNNYAGIVMNQLFAVSDVFLEVGWEKRYIYQSRIKDILNTNGILDSKDIYKLNIKTKQYVFKNTFSLGVNGHGFYNTSVTIPFILDSHLSIISAYYGENSHISSRGDLYSETKALNLFNKPINNDSNYVQVMMDDIFNTIYLGVDYENNAGSKTTNGLGGFKVLASNNLVVDHQIRYSKSDLSVSNISAILFCQLKF